MKKSIFGNLRYNNSSNCPKKILHFNDFTNVTFGTPAFLTTKNYTQTITSSSIVSAIMNGFFDASYVLQLQLITDRDVAGADDAAKLVDLATLIENSKVTVAGPFGSNVTALYQNTKVRTTTIGLGNSAPQNWLRILRNAPGASGSGTPPSDMKHFYMSYWVKMQVDGADSLATNLDVDHVSANAFWRVFFDMKTNGYLGSEGGGDLRITTRVHEDATGLFWRTQMDNSAANTTVPGVTGAAATYWQVDSRTPVPPSNEWVKFEISIDRPDPVVRSYPSAHPDTTTGRVVVSITPASTMEPVIICDKTGDVMMGVHDLPWGQMFLAGVYSLAGGQINQYIYDLQIWDSAPRFMGWSDTVAVDASLAGGATQPREGTDTLSIDFTSSTPTQVTIARNDNASFAVWPGGAMSEHFTAVTGGLEFDISLAHMNLGVNTIGVKASYADYRKSNDSLSVTIEAVTPEPVTKTITVSMLGGLNQTRQGRDVFQIDFTSGTPTSLVFARNDNATFAQWPAGNLQAYFTEVTGGLEFDLELTALNLGSNTLAVTATYSDASTATDSLSLVLTEIDAGAVTLGPLPWVPTPLASATMFASPTGSDANPGTLASPKTWQGAITAATPGSVVFLRGGTYPVTDAAHIQAWAVGTAGAPIIFESYPGELAIIDGSGMTPWVGNKRINVSGQYQKFRGLRVTGFPENGFLVGTGSHHTTIDGCEIDNCHLSGIMNFNSSDNRYINCHVHDCSDVGGPANGGNADGISVASGSRNYVGNCLVERCSDDGIDAWQSQYSVFEFNIVAGCGLGDGNGNGFKCGGADIGANAMVNNNLAYNNRALGFDVNTGINVTFKNNTSYDNDAQGYGLEPDTICINNVSSGDGSIKYGTGIPTNNSWNITGTLTFISTTEGNANFLKVTQGGAFDGIGWEYI